MAEVITIKEMLTEMETGKPFACTAVAYDRLRKTGGGIKEYLEVALVQKTERVHFDGRPLTAAEIQENELEQLKKNPHHRKWYTRNIRELVNGHPTSIIRKIHPPLVMTFNGIKVVP